MVYLTISNNVKAINGFSNYKQLIVAVWVTIVSVGVGAQAPAGYYAPAYGKTGAQLKTALYGVLSDPFESQTYDFLYTIYERSDSREDGSVWDMYSKCSWTHREKLCGNQSRICDCYNREHSIPASWFGNAAPMYTDAFHLYPTDGRVNNFRGNLPFGEAANGVMDTKNPSDTNGLGRWGASTFPGYSGTVFEPVDEYKGDFARTYFYFATRYENYMTSLSSTNALSFNRTTYPAFTDWSLSLFLKWHRQDTVSQKEITRNNVIYEYQKNRNAFIDHPLLAEYIWGTLKGTPWNVTGFTSPAELAARFQYNSTDRKMVTAADLGEARYEVINVSGVRILSGTILGGDAVSVASLGQGVYFFRIDTGELKAVKKFIVH